MINGKDSYVMKGDFNYMLRAKKTKVVSAQDLINEA